jgi:hypothetical protein
MCFLLQSKAGNVDMKEFFSSKIRRSDRKKAASVHRLPAHQWRLSLNLVELNHALRPLQFLWRSHLHSKHAYQLGSE